ncbi:MAG: winged helix-turn-helix domain-containing protein, partial [Acidimicrobiales bacterium]
AKPRPAGARRPGKGQLVGLLDRLGTLQLDAVNVLERTQFLVPFARLGAYDRDDLRSLSGPGRPWFEYWGHAASLLPVELYPLFRPRMAAFSHDQVDGPVAQRRRAAWRTAHADYLAAVLREVEERGPLAASELADPRRQAGEWWDRRSLGRRALELLFGDGVLAGWRTTNFERVYDLAERVIPAEFHSAPSPSLEESQRELLVLAARCLGVATTADLADYFGVRPAQAKVRVAELVEDRRLEEVAVEGWRQPAYAVGPVRPRAPRRAVGTLLSPFDSLIWNRDRTERLFGFRYRIEIYVPEPLRTHGYYVLPLLVGDQLVGRFDLKSDRKTSTLRVAGAHAEPGADDGTVVEAAVPELRGIAAWLGMERVASAGRGELAGPLARALAARVSSS